MKPARTMTIAVLASTLALTGCGGAEGGGADYTAADARAGAAFRFHARDAYAWLNPKCPYTQQEQYLARYAELQDRFDALEGRVESTAFATDLIAIKADYDYYWENNQADCAPVDTPETENLVTQELARIENALGQMERAVGGT